MCKTLYIQFCIIGYDSIISFNKIYGKMEQIRKIRGGYSNMNEKYETDLITIEEMGKILKIGRSKAYRLVKMKGFPIVKIGKCIRVDRYLLFWWLHDNQNML